MLTNNQDHPFHMTVAVRGERLRALLVDQVERLKIDAAQLKKREDARAQLARVQPGTFPLPLGDDDNTSEKIGEQARQLQQLADLLDPAETYRLALNDFAMLDLLTVSTTTFYR